MAEKWLIFVDTNIFLDFYRMSGGEAAKKQIAFINNNSQYLITTDLVKMEFLKNRQKIILDTLKEVKQDIQHKQLPPILLDTNIASATKTITNNYNKQKNKTQSYVEKILHNPTTKDDVYKCVQKFSSKSELFLDIQSDIGKDIILKARHRWELGYPPRKNSDTSINDAVNWEWILNCTKKHNANVVIVTRDEDYGAKHNHIMYLNDLLAKEFSQKNGTRKKIHITQKLSEAMKRLNVSVTKEIRDAEIQIISSHSSSASISETSLL